MKTTENAKQPATGEKQPVNGNPVNDESVKANAEKKPEKPQSKPEQPKAEPAKKEQEQPKAEKAALNLSSTMELVRDLSRRIIQRDRLVDTVHNLEAFEVEQKTDADETDANHFQGCVLTIQDDKRREFSTKNPVIVQHVAQYVNAMCLAKLSEIEAGIIIPS